MIDEVKLFRTGDGKVYQNKEDAELMDKIEKFVFDLESSGLRNKSLGYLILPGRASTLLKVIRSGEFVQTVNLMMKMYNYHLKGIEYKKEVEPEEIKIVEKFVEKPKIKGFYDRLAAALYLMTHGEIP